MALRFLDKQKRGLFLDRARLIPATIADLIPAAGGEISLVLAAYSESGPSTLTSPVINIASSDRPLAGTISLAYNSVSLGAFDTTAISAAGLAAYLNSSSGIKTDGGVDVWETDGNTYTIQMRSVGAVDTLALEYADFIPFGNAVIESIQTGDADERQAWTLRIEYGVIARQDAWTQSSTVSATITEVVTGSASVCEVQKIALSGTLVSGWWNIGTASGLTSQLRWDASAAAVEGAINVKLGAGTVKVTQTADQTYLIAWVAVGAVSALTVTTTALTAIQTSTATLDLDTAEAASLPNGSRVQVQIMEGTEVLHQEQFYLSRLNNAGTYSEVGRAQFVRYDAAQTLTSDQQTQARSNISAAKSGAVTGSSLTMATARLLGRTTASTGAIEEISIGSGLSLSGGVLSSTASSAWGGITGTLSDQTDLINALNAKADLAGATFTGTVTVGGAAPDFYGLALVPGTGTMTVSRATLGNTEYAQVSPTLIRLAGSVDSAGLDLYRGGLEIVNTSGFGAIIGSSLLTADRTFAFPNTAGTLMVGANNLSDVSSVSTARTNLGLGTGDSLQFTALTLTGQSLTGSQATNLMDLAATWNTTGTPTAIKLNVTDTASNASSRLLDLQVGGTSVYNRDKNGYHRKYDLNNAVTWPLFSGGAFGADQTVSAYQTGGVNYAFRIGSTWAMAFVTNDPGIHVYETLSMGPSGQGPDIWLARKSAANIRQGLYDVASPVSQYSSVQNVAAGTSNTAGVARYYDACQGTGTGAGGSIVDRTAPPGASGSAQNSLTTRNFVYGGEKTLTESTATIVVNVTVAAGKYIGGELIVTTHADDATDFQAITEHLTFCAVNKAGTVTATIQATPSTSTTAASAGTLTTAWTAVVNGNSVDIKNNAVSSLTQTTLKCSYQLRLNTDDAVTVTP